AESGARRMRAVALLAALVGIQFTGGHIETSVDVLFCLGAYHGLRWWQGAGRRQLALLLLPALAVALGTALAAVQLLPFLEWLPLSAEYQRRLPAGIALFDPRSWHEVLALPLVLFPNLYGNPTWPGARAAAASSAWRWRSWRRARCSPRRATSCCRTCSRASRLGVGTSWTRSTRPCPRRPTRSSTTMKSSTRWWPAWWRRSASGTSRCTRPPSSRSAAGCWRGAPRAGRFSSSCRRESWLASGAGTRLRCRFATSTRRPRPRRGSPATGRSTARRRSARTWSPTHT